jgi:hypothetical protein
MDAGHLAGHYWTARFLSPRRTLSDGAGSSCPVGRSATNVPAFHQARTHRTGFFLPSDVWCVLWEARRLVEIVDDRLLLPIKVTCKVDHKEMERLYNVRHGANRLSAILSDNYIIRLVRIFAPYGWITSRISLGSEGCIIFADHRRTQCPGTGNESQSVFCQSAG